jgi:hypothetical protein
MISFRLDTEIDYNILVKESGLDLSAVDKKIKDLYEARHEAKIILKSKQAVVDAVRLPDNTPDEPVSVSDLAKLLEDYNAMKNRNRDKTEDHCRVIDQASNTIKTITDDINRTESKIKDLESMLLLLKSDLSKMKKDLDAAFISKAAIKEPELEVWSNIDPIEIRIQMEQAEVVNAAVHKKKELQAAKKEVLKADSNVAMLESQYSAAVQEKVDMIAAVDFGLEGLSIDPDNKQVLFNGLPFGSRSKGEALLIGLEWLARRNPQLKFAITCQIEDFLDDDNFAKFHAKAADLGIQILSEQVRSVDPAAIEIVQVEN